MATRLYREFQKYKPVGGITRQDPVSVSAVSYKASDNTLIESLQPTKDTTYYPNGHYYVQLDDSKYSPTEIYYVLWTFAMAPGYQRTHREYFRIAEAGGIVYVPVKVRELKASVRSKTVLKAKIKT